MQLIQQCVLARAQQGHLAYECHIRNEMQGVCIASATGRGGGIVVGSAPYWAAAPLLQLLQCVECETLAWRPQADMQGVIRGLLQVDAGVECFLLEQQRCVGALLKRQALQ